MRPDPLDAARGELLQFDYPEKNLVDVRPIWRSRTVVVERVIDTLHEPVPSHWFQLRPLIRRGRFLIVGYDIDRGGRRQFYREAMRHTRRAHWLQLAVYDPCDQTPSLRIQQPFAPTPEDRLFLAKVIRRFHRVTRHRGNMWMNLGVFPCVADELRPP